MREMVAAYPDGRVRWREVADRLPGRLGKQCRERWYNQLDPSINTGPWNEEEDQMLSDAQEKYGNRWSSIAKALGTGRTENGVKNRFNSAAFKKVRRKLYNSRRNAPDMVGETAEMAESTETS